jgi:hypothetical protein
LSDDDDGYAVAVAPCCSCRRSFTFNPHRVPSLRINGKREPICRGCVDAANQTRVKQGLEPHPILPDAYEAIPISEL